MADVGDGAISDCKKEAFPAENGVPVTIRMLQVLDDMHERCRVDVDTFRTCHCIHRCVCYVFPARACVMDINICDRPIEFRNCTKYDSMCMCHILHIWLHQPPQHFSTTV